MSAALSNARILVMFENKIKINRLHFGSLLFCFRLKHGISKEIHLEDLENVGKLKL